MKDNFIIFLISLLFLFSCDKSDNLSNETCVKSSVDNIATVNLFDRNPQSIYYNQVAANFKFSQESTSYYGGISCPPMNCNTTLSIFNPTSRKIIFSYNIYFSLNNVSWNYQGAATILSGGTYNLGQVNSSCANISYSNMIIQSSNIIYQ